MATSFNDPYGLISSGLPPELAAQARGISREQQIAEALMQQAQQPMQGRQVGQVYVAPHPLEGVAKLVQAYMGRRGADETDRKYADLSNRYQQGVADAMERYQRTRTGDPGRAPALDPQEVEQQADTGVQVPNVGGTPGDPRRAITEAMTNPYLRNNPMIAEDLRAMRPVTLGRSLVDPSTGKPIAVDSTWQAEQQAAREERRQELLLKLQDARLARDQREAYQRELAQMNADLRREMVAANIAARREIAGLTAASRPVTPVTIQDPNDPNKTIVIDGRTRQPFGAGPKMTETGKMEAKRSFAMQGFGEIVSEARSILSDPNKKPTGSGIGAIADKVGNVFGATLAGAEEAGKLEAAGAALISKMPRMEGPQSDKDVKLYTDSAAKVGDRTIPIKQRLAALDTVESLWAKYEKRPTTPSTPTAGAPRVVDFNSLPPGNR